MFCVVFVCRLSRIHFADLLDKMLVGSANQTFKCQGGKSQIDLRHLILINESRRRMTGTERAFGDFSPLPVTSGCQDLVVRL